MKYIIWGAGGRGKIIFDLLGKEQVLAFIDSNPEKQGKKYLDCPIIDYETYKKDYRSYVIIVSMVFGGGVTELLEKDGIFYFNLEDCPPEFMGYGWIRAKKAVADFQWDIPDHVILYGATLYTALVYERLLEKGHKNISILLSESKRERAGACFERLFHGVRIIQKKDIRAEHVYLTEKAKPEELGLKDDQVTDIVDWTHYIKDYRNDRIETLRDKYKGRRCFVVATGPSLNYGDLNLLAHNREFCISVNSIFTCFSETVWRPDCYVVLDATGIMLWKEQFEYLEDIRYKFIADCQPYFDYTELDDDWYIYHSILDRYSIENMLFSENFSEKVFNGSNVIYVCIQLAVYLGFQEIYLLGVDYNYKKGTRNHFTTQIEPEKRFGGMEEQNRIQDISYFAFKKANEYAHEHGIKICNASRATCLDVFECVSLEKLF